MFLSHRQYPDRRKRRRRVELVANGFAGQIDAMTDAYMEWSAKIQGSLNKDPPVPDVQTVPFLHRRRGCISCV